MDSKKLLFVAIFVLLQFSLLPNFLFGINKIDSLLNLLDKAILEKESFINLKEMRIKGLKELLKNKDLSLSKIYNLNASLFEEYKVYKSDSALHYIERNFKISEVAHNLDWLTKTKMDYSFLLYSTGLFKESVDNLNSIDRKFVSNNLLPEYYLRYEHAYIYLAQYASDNKYAPEYYRIAVAYRDSLLTISNPASDIYKFVYGEKLLQSGDKGSLKYFLEYFSKSKSGTQEYAMIAAILSAIYKFEHKLEKHQEYLVLSAISDIKASVKENTSLRLLAILLFENGDVDRAYEYIKCSLEDANFYNARLRSIEISRIQPIIDKAYQIKNEKQRDRLRFYLLLISILSVFLVFTMVYIYIQMKKLSIARKESQNANIQLNTLNLDLHKVNARLKELNQKLFESNHIKEEYIGHFLDLCSTYVNKLESYRKMLIKKATSGQIEELFKTLKSSQLIDNETEELYTNFDNTFLSLFPDFVNEFNTLLVNHERIVLKPGELLNTELRIFALIRLGITDSSKIADFLRYSVNTIYNYRVKIKNKSSVSRSNFETEVMKIESFPK